MTMRSFYRLVLKLHPAAFRERFGDEMLCIFDEAAIGWAVCLWLRMPAYRSFGSGCASPHCGNGRQPRSAA